MPTVATSPSMASHSWSEVYSVVVILKSSAFVGVFHEGHGGDRERQSLAAHLGEQAGAERAQCGGHVAHRDRRVQARAEAARCDRSDRRGGCRIRKQQRALAHRRAAFRAQADAAAAGTLIEMGEDLLGAGETTGAGAATATALLHRP